MEVNGVSVPFLDDPVPCGVTLMATQEERDLNQAAYRRLKGEIDRTYARGRYVAIAEGQIVANAASFKELNSKLGAAGLDSPEVLVVQAGVEYPETAHILFFRAA